MQKKLSFDLKVSKDNGFISILSITFQAISILRKVNLRRRRQETHFKWVSKLTSFNFETFWVKKSFFLQGWVKLLFFTKFFHISSWRRSYNISSSRFAKMELFLMLIFRWMFLIKSKIFCKIGPQGWFMQCSIYR